MLVKIVKFNKFKKELTSKKLLQELLDRDDVNDVCIIFSTEDNVRLCFSSMTYEKLTYLMKSGEILLTEELLT